MPIVAFCTCILVGWVIKPKALTDEVTKNGEKFGRKKLFNVMDVPKLSTLVEPLLLQMCTTVQTQVTSTCIRIVLVVRFLIKH